MNIKSSFSFFPVGRVFFYIAIFFLFLFEIANVYFIMPMPGSQEIKSIDLAYSLYSWRWIVRGLFGLITVLGFKNAFESIKWLPIVVVLSVLGVAYATHFEMAADTMFYQLETLTLKSGNENTVEQNRLVLGVTYEGTAKAYPIQYLGYHHQVRDSIGNKAIMITYCTVCRTGRVYEPLVHGKLENFRLVGMDHFNAMFEDETTKSWWRQATGEAVAGELKGQSLYEFPSAQMSLKKWQELYPNTLVMQPDKKYQAEYDSLSNYETGKRKGKLTKRDTGLWQPKSWIVGVKIGKESKVFDWNRLQKERIIYDVLDNKPIVVMLSSDNVSFVAFQRSNENQYFTFDNDSLKTPETSYNFVGKSQNTAFSDLKRIKAYQEYWHSWQVFQTEKK